MSIALSFLVLRAASNLAFCNPFLPERNLHERAALGAEFVEDEPVWSLSVDEPDRRRSNVWRIAAHLEEVCPRLRQKLATGAAANQPDLILYEDAVLNLLYQRYYPRFFAASCASMSREAILRISMRPESSSFSGFLSCSSIE